MTSGHLNHILCAANPRGSVDAVERLLATSDDRGAQAIALVGDLGDHEGSRNVLRALGHAQIPACWVPGPGMRRSAGT
ncbi:MAG: hypothetical protein ACXVUE_20490 [Solirubrobacteraceae bacterium]